MPEKIRGFDKFGLEHSVSSARDSKQVSAVKTAEKLLEVRKEKID